MDQKPEPVSAGPDLLLTLSRGAGSLHEQLERRLRDGIRSGRLPPSLRMPSSRSLAQQLGVSRGVILEAYSQLVAEGYLVASQGAATRVADAPRVERLPVAAGSLAREYRVSLDPGTPDLSAFPRESWMRSLRAAARQAPFSALGHEDPRGLPELRNELMSYLGRARAGAPEPEHTIVCSGFTQGFSLLCRALTDRGVERVALEDPGWSQHRLIAERAGLEAVPVATDADGISVNDLVGTGCDVVVVTPAHQFPTGVVLSSERRGALLEWAEDHDGLIVEDDYDSELRLERGAVGSLQGLAPERVCHIGSVSKRLAPGLSLGWVLSPSWLSGALTYEKGTADGGSPALDQLALADFLARGELDRHIRRMRLVYRRRRALLEETLRECLPEARPHGGAVGFYALIYLPGSVNEPALIAAAARQGISLTGLSEHRRATQSAQPGLVLGYGSASEPELAQSIDTLSEIATSIT